jgi:predicted DNA binding protein
VLLELRARERATLRAPLEEYALLHSRTLFDDPEAASAMLRFETCACCRTGGVIPAMEKAGYLYLPPTVYEPEGEKYEFLGTQEGAGRQVLEGMKDRLTVDSVCVHPVQNLGTGDGLLVPSGALFSETTPRQRQALLLAIARGYYRIPRDIGTEELARQLGISREAFEALLRKAENKILLAVGPYLQMDERTDAPASGPR